MSELSFFDTNIIIYTDDRTDLAKHNRAVSLWHEHREQRTGLISIQVLQEYFSTVTKKLAMPAEKAQRKVEIMAAGRVVRFEARDVPAAIELHRLARISFWDALIVQAARVGGAKVLYSEDMQHGSTIGGVRVVNPFLASS